MRGLLVVLPFLALTMAVADAGDWPAWRGPRGTGVAEESNLPVRWSAEENIAWKIALPGPGNSTPVVSGGRVFLAQASDDGRRRALMCFDRESGKLLWERAAEYPAKEPTHETNPQCSSSPATDGKTVVVWHGSAGLFAYDLDGKELWRRDLGEFRHVWGVASSPALYDGLVLLNAGPGLRAFVAAFDLRTGDEVWRKTFPEMTSEKLDEYRGSWSTPVFYQEGNRTLALLSLPLRLYAVDPRTGEEVWSCGGLGKLVYTSPLVSDDSKTVVAMSGYHGASLAVRTGGTGDVTATHRLWLHEGQKLNPQRVGSGVIVGDAVYILNEPGVAWCMDLASGKIRWEKRLGGNSWSSIVYADGKLYASDMDGTTHVLRPDAERCEVLAENALGELTRASPAVSNGQIILRTYKHLYRIGGR